MRTFKERIKDIEEHFDSLTIEEFEKNMYNAGAYKIKAAEESGFRLSSSEEITLETDLDSFEIEDKNYDASKYDAENLFELENLNDCKGCAA